MKKLFFILLAFTILCSCSTGCKKRTPDSTDLSSYSFVNADWERTTDSCTETIYFSDDGECGYFCACGNPVNDDDLCEGYSYDPDTATIYYDFFEKTKDTVTRVKVISCSDDTLVLDFDGDRRTFTKVSDEGNSYTDSLTYEGKNYLLLEYNQDIFFYDLAYYVDYEEDENLPLDHDKWDLVYRDGDIFILDTQAEEAIAFYADDSNYTWSVIIYPDDSEDEYSIPLTVSDSDVDYIYKMDSMERDRTLAFDDIEVFATLAKTSSDGLIQATVSLAAKGGEWFWRSEVIDDTADGWPEYVFPLPESLTSQIKKHFNND